MNILITGTSGLLGSAMVEIFSKQNKIKKIICLDKRKISFLEIKNKKIKYKYFDICQKNKLRNLILKEKINIIFHTAAITQVTEAYDKPELTYKNNVDATTNFLEIIRKINKKIIFIYSSSDKAYGKLALNKEYFEDDKLLGDFTYDASKSASDIIVQSYSKTYGLRVGILRCGNIFGPKDLNFQRLIPGLIYNACKNKKLPLRSNGKNKRDYLYVIDVVNAYYLLMLRMIKTRNQSLFIYNIGSTNNFSVMEVCKKILSLLKKKELTPVILNNSKIEIPYQKLNYSKARKELHWKPSYTFREGIIETTKWYYKNIDKIRKFL